MKNRAITLAILLFLPASLGLAEDFTTVSGKIYKDATISRIEGDGLVLRTKTGISKVYFIELSKDVQEKYHYRQATPVPAQRQREPIKLEPTQTGARQGGGGPKMVVVGQRSGRQQTDSGGFAGALPVSGLFLRLLGVGALIIAGLALVIIRRRRRSS